MVAEDTNYQHRHRERGSKAYITPKHITHNLKVFKQLHPGPMIAVVKADAYGHGIEWTVSALTAADAFAVATIEEAQQLRKVNKTKRIILLEGVFNVKELAIAIKLKLDMVLHQDYQLRLLSQVPPLKKVAVWLKIDSGMGRLGFAYDRCDEVIDALKLNPAVHEIRLMSHYAASDEPESPQTLTQIQINQHLKEKGFEYSFSNTGAVLNGINHAAEWARVGLGLFGLSPLTAPRFGREFNLLPAMQLTAKIIATKRIPKGHSVGYGGTFTASHDMRLGIVGMGYADGYPWSHKQSKVSVKGQLVAVLGRVSMDMIAIDLTGFDAPMTGEEVTLWGAELPAEQVAQDLDLIPYTLVCGVKKRVKYYHVQ